MFCTRRRVLWACTSLWGPTPISHPGVARAAAGYSGALHVMQTCRGVGGAARSMSACKGLCVKLGLLPVSRAHHAAAAHMLGYGERSPYLVRHVMQQAHHVVCAARRAHTIVGFAWARWQRRVRRRSNCGRVGLKCWLVQSLSAASMCGAYSVGGTCLPHTWHMHGLM
jgi:hypothetical protein